MAIEIKMIVLSFFFDCKAKSAKWEPPHGRFMHALYPWSQYVKVGAVLRNCAYEVMALHSIARAEIQVYFLSVSASVHAVGLHSAFNSNIIMLDCVY